MPDGPWAHVCVCGRGFDGARGVESAARHTGATAENRMEVSAVLAVCEQPRAACAHCGTTERREQQHSDTDARTQPLIR